MRILTMNCEWRAPSSRDGEIISARIGQSESDLVCLTEAHAGFALGPHAIDTGPIHDPENSRRSVVLFSRERWSDVQVGLDCERADYGYVAGTTKIHGLKVRVHGIIIPYRFCDVGAGAKLWQRHAEFIDALSNELHDATEPTIIIGDFNQRRPARYQSRAMTEALDRMLENRFSFATADLSGPERKLAIDHIVHSAHFEAATRGIISNLKTDGRKVSDHFGVFSDFRVRSRG